MSRAIEVTTKIACADLFFEGVSIISGWIEGRALDMLQLGTDCA